VPGTGWARGQSDGGDHRQPERQGRGKRGLSIDPPGYDAGKRIKDKKRHLLVDTQGLLMQAIIHAADIQDRDGGVLLMGAVFGLYPFLLKLYADSGYQGAKFQRGLSETCGRVNLEIVKRCDLYKFVVLPNAGSSSGPSAGSTVADASPRIGNASTAALLLSCVGLPSASCSENSAKPHYDPGWTLRRTCGLGRTQPALSKYIDRLEDEIGTKLFDHVGRGLRLTTVGEVLLEQSTAMRKAMEGTIRRLSEHADGMAGTLRIGISPAVIETAAPKLISLVLAQSPEVKVRVVADGSARLLAALTGC
jgi:hypothetical protein